MSAIDVKSYLPFAFAGFPREAFVFGGAHVLATFAVPIVLCAGGETEVGLLVVERIAVDVVDE